MGEFKRTLTIRRNAYTCQVYLLHKFVSRPSKKSKGTQAITPSKSGSGSTTAVDTPIAATPSSQQGGDVAENLKAAASSLINTTEPDGAVVYTVAIAQLCFKIGRITVPPELAYAMNGLASTEGYSHENPPPHWKNVLELCSLEHGGSRKKMRAFMKGGWKDVKAEDRWWVKAMEGLKERNEKGLQVLGELKKAMEGARDL